VEVQAYGLCSIGKQLRFTRFTKKGLQSRSATASLLIKRKTQFMEKKIKLVIVLAQEIKHIVSSCRGKQRCIFPAERKNHVGIGAVEKNMLLILAYVIWQKVNVPGGVCAERKQVTKYAQLLLSPPLGMWRAPNRCFTATCCD